MNSNFYYLWGLRINNGNPEPWLAELNPNRCFFNFDFRLDRCILYAPDRRLFYAFMCGKKQGQGQIRETLSRRKS